MINYKNLLDKSGNESLKLVDLRRLQLKYLKLLMN